MPEESSYSSSDTEVSASTATVRGETYQLQDIHAVYVEQEVGITGSVIAVALAIIGMVFLLAFAVHAYFSLFDPTFGQMAQRMLMSPEQIARRQFFDVLVPVSIAAALMIGLIALRKTMRRDVLVIDFIEGPARTIEGLTRVEAEQVRDAIDRAIGARDAGHAMQEGPLPAG